MDRLAEVYETFEDTWDIVVKESAAGDMLFASEEDAADELDAAQQQEDALEALEECRKNMESAYREFSNYPALGSETLRTEEGSGRSKHENLSATRKHSSSHKWPRES